MDKKIIKEIRYKDGTVLTFYNDGGECVLLIQKENQQLKIQHPDFGFLYEMKDYYVDMLKNLRNRQDISVLEKMWKID